jgi:hypothetical protein
MPSRILGSLWDHGWVCVAGSGTAEIVTIGGQRLPLEVVLLPHPIGDLGAAPGAAAGPNYFI